MSGSSDHSSFASGTAAWFATTHWTVVRNARDGGSTEAGVALEKLCQTYWYPLYAFVRRQGHSPHDAPDLTQEFFARLLAKDYLADVDRGWSSTTQRRWNLARFVLHLCPKKTDFRRTRSQLDLRSISAVAST